MQNITKTLEQWLKSQIKRGCTLESMVATMQEGGYALAIAQNHVVAAFVAAGKLNQPFQALLPHHSSNHLFNAHTTAELTSQEIAFNADSQLNHQER